MKPKKNITRRELIKRFGTFAFLLSPVLRSMAYAASTPYATAPRFVMFFKGGAFLPSQMNMASLNNLAGSPIAPLQAHANNMILFRNMNTTGGRVQSPDYQEEHAGGLFGCTTGNTFRYSNRDAYYAYTDNESIDMRIARHYQTITELQSLPFSSLHVGAGAHSDADSVGLGQRYISFRNRQNGDARYGNAIEPIQNARQVYNMLMERINLICSKDSNQPGADIMQTRQALIRKKSLVDFKLNEINDAKRIFGMDSEHSRKLDSLVSHWRESEILMQQQIENIGSTATPATRACPVATNPDGNGANVLNCDQLSPIHDQMIQMIKLAFEWDLTRVAAFTLSGASGGQSWPSQGINRSHHSLEHSDNADALRTMGSYYSGKFSNLLTALSEIDDGNGETGLRNSAVLLGMECWSTGANAHHLTNIPYILAGQGGGKFNTGRIVDAAGRNNNDLLVSIQRACGINSNVFGLPNLCQGPIV